MACAALAEAGIRGQSLGQGRFDAAR